MSDAANYANLYQLIGGVLVALITGYFGSKVIKRGGRAGEDADRIDEGVNSVGGFVELVKQQSVAIESLTARTRSLEGAQEVNDKITQGLRERIQKISQDLDSMHMWKRAALRYILELRAHGLKHAREEELPTPPVELMGDLRNDAA